MSRGTYDYNRDLSDGQEYISRDLNELAARSNVNLQVLRSGNVIHNLFPIMFNNPTLFNYTGADSYVLHSQRGVYGYDRSLKFITGAVLNNGINLSYFVPPTLSPKIGIMAYNGFLSTNSAHYLIMNMSQSGYLYSATLELKLGSGDISVSTTGGAMQLVGNITIDFATYSPTIFKMVIDTEAKRYCCVKLNVDNVIDLSSVPLNFWATGNADAIGVQWIYNTWENVSHSAYLQDIIVTINEV